MTECNQSRGWFRYRCWHFWRHRPCNWLSPCGWRKECYKCLAPHLVAVALAEEKEIDDAAADDRRKCSHKDITLRCDLDEYECLDCGAILYDGPIADPGQ